jgi:hypothetical protein
MFSPPARNEPAADDLSRRLYRGADAPTPVHRPPGTPPPRPAEQGDFTRMFAAPPQLDAPPGGPGSGRSDSLPGLGAPPAGPPSPGPGGSEYTRALKRVSFTDIEPARPPERPKPEPTPPKPPSRLPVVLIVVGAIVLLAMVLLLYVSLSGI